MKNIVNGIANVIKRQAAYNQTVRELSSLDNRQLNDLGITRADIHDLARNQSSLF